MNLFVKDTKALIVGDFNAPKINWKTFTSSRGAHSYEKLLLYFVKNKKMKQYVKQATHGGNVIDLVIADQNLMVSNLTTVDIDSQSIHHKGVRFEISLSAGKQILPDQQDVSSMSFTFEEQIHPEEQDVFSMSFISEEQIQPEEQDVSSMSFISEEQIPAEQQDVSSLIHSYLERLHNDEVTTVTVEEITEFLTNVLSKYEETKYKPEHRKKRQTFKDKDFKDIQPILEGLTFKNNPKYYVEIEKLVFAYTLRYDTLRCISCNGCLRISADGTGKYAGDHENCDLKEESKQRVLRKECKAIIVKRFDEKAANFSSGAKDVYNQLKVCFSHMVCDLEN
uniref:Endonuclease/exonuclease/phosphatase domain-containing protein n=1 Tax=Panagrolaimus sp. JU765 TaxID=591449 RepID=A0AC34RDT7_9BILA